MQEGSLHGSGHGARGKGLVDPGQGTQHVRRGGATLTKKNHSEDSQALKWGLGSLRGPWRVLRSGSSPGQPAPKSLLTLLLLKGLGVESSQFLSNLDGSQVPL